MSEFLKRTNILDAEGNELEIGKVVLLSEDGTKRLQSRIREMQDIKVALGERDAVKLNAGQISVAWRAKINNIVDGRVHVTLEYPNIVNPPYSKADKIINDINIFLPNELLLYK